jgi:hypothetical protein
MRICLIRLREAAGWGVVYCGQQEKKSTENEFSRMFTCSRMKAQTNWREELLLTAIIMISHVKALRGRSQKKYTAKCRSAAGRNR